MWPVDWIPMAEKSSANAVSGAQRCAIGDSVAAAARCCGHLLRAELWAGGRPQRADRTHAAARHLDRRRGVLDGGETKILLQVSSKTVIGPIFFELIQRKGDDGFGEGNFRALLESIEEDQIRRGVLKVNAVE